MAAVRKRKRITPTLLTAPAGPDPSVTGAPLADVPTAVAVKFSTSQELEVVSKAVKQLQPLKVVTNAGYMAVLLRDARILVFDHQAMLCETSIAHLCQPQELLSLQLRDSEPVISATKGRIFFFRRSVGQWFSFSSTTSEEELLLASVLGPKEFQSKFVSFAESPQADPQYFRELCSRLPSLRSLTDLPNLSAKLADV